MCSRKDLDVILEKLTEVYQKVYGDSIDKILLYGSYAREDYKEDSDIDVVAIVHGTREDLQDQLKQIWDYSAQIGRAHV